MRPYGKAKKCKTKIHSSDRCSLCGNDNHAVIKGKERQKNKVKIKEEDCTT